MKESANPLTDKAIDGISVETLSLLSHCKACATSCCQGKYIITTGEEREKVLTAGHADHFDKVTIPEGDFYILNFSYSMCKYADDKGACTIQDVKPIVCQTYPAIYHFTSDGGFGSMGADRSCPAAPFLPKDFLDKARPLIEKYRADLPYDLRQRITAASREEYKRKKALEGLNNG